MAELTTLDHMRGAAEEDEDGRPWVRPDVAAKVADRLTVAVLRRLSENTHCPSDETMLNETADNIERRA